MDQIRDCSPGTVIVLHGAGDTRFDLTGIKLFLQIFFNANLSKHAVRQVVNYKPEYIGMRVKQN